MATRNKRGNQSRQTPRTMPEYHTPDETGPMIDLGTQPPPPDEALALLHRIQEHRGSKLLTLVACPDVMIRGDVIEQVYEQLRLIGRVPQIDLFLHSSGGQTEIPWRLITLIRDFSERFAVLVPGIAHSAATHVAMGADEIVMGPLSELTPVDPARFHPMLPKGPEGESLMISVQDLRHCVEFVKKELGASSPDSTAKILTALFDKVHPLAIGAMQQSYELSRLISEKALSTHMDPDKDKERIRRIVDAFSDSFFSHQYRIGWKEAQGMGLKVVQASPDLWETMWALYRHYNAYFTLARSGADKREAARPIVWIDSVYQRRILEELLALPTPKQPEPISLQRKASRWLTLDWQQGTVGDEGQ